MDTNQLLLWTVVLLCGVTIGRHYRPRPGYRGWLVKALLIAATTGLCQVLAPSVAGYVGAAGWTVLVLVPLFGSRWLLRLVGHQQYGKARRLAGFLGFMHPADGWPRLPLLYGALEAAQQGERPRAVELAQQLQTSVHVSLRRQASVLLYRINGDWAGLLRWLEQEASEEELARDPVALGNYVRALGETGQLDRLLTLIQRHRSALEGPRLLTERGLVHLYAFAFCGQIEATTRVLDQLLRAFGPEARAFWLATAESAAGDQASARVRLEALARQGDQMLRAAVESRLAHPPVQAVSALTPDGTRQLEELLKQLTEQERYAERLTSSGPPPLITRTLIGFNLAMFLVVVLAGGSEDVGALYEWGAILLPGFSAGDWWRLVTATFLHIGLLHLVANMLGLAALGPYLERAIGARRYLGVYLLSGIFSSLCVVVLASSRSPAEPMIFAGASGSIMGIIGGTAAVLWRGWRTDGARTASRRLRTIGVILAMQVALDLLIPRISLTAHVAGLALGFLAGALVKHW